MHFYKAERIFDGYSFLPRETVLAIDEQGVLRDIINEDAIDTLKIQTLKGVISPGFINAHCHTELSHLKNVIPRHTGLPDFGRRIISERNAFPKEEIKEKIKEADREMRTKGIVAVGDISNTDESFEMKSESSIYYHTFIELLGFHPERALPVMDAGKELMKRLTEMGLHGSLAPHAPYSTSLELISAISEFNLDADLPSTIHNQETTEENKFFLGQKSQFEDLYNFLKLDISWFEPPNTTSLNHYLPALKSQKTLLVHNTFSPGNDIHSATKETIFWCFCPAANLYIENQLPDYSLFESVKNRVCIGTDSLASNSQLDLIAEANIILSNSDYSEEEILRSMTSVPAKALGIDNKFGSLKIGSESGINHCETEGRKLRFIKSLKP